MFREGADRLVICQLRVTLPRGVVTGEISRMHPDAIFDITNWTVWGGGTNLVILRIYTSEKWDAVKEIQEQDDVISVEDHTAGGSAQELHIIHKAPPFSALLKQFGVMQKTPIRINNGVSTWEIVGTAANIQHLISALHKMSVAVVPDPLYRNADLSMPTTFRRDLVPELGSQPNDTSETGHFIVCKLRCTLPRPFWHSEMEKRHPQVVLDVLGYTILENEMLVDLRVHTDDVTKWADELRSFEDIYDVKPIGGPNKSPTLRVTYKAYDLQAAIHRLHLVPRTPFTIKEGVAELVMAGPEQSIRQFIEMFPELQAQVEAVYNTEREGAALLTPRQSFIFQKALAAGYFEVPRRVTLTELAARIGVAVSSLSEMLAVVERKLLQDSQPGRGQ
jgi:predicted DNA binding protein